MDDSELNRGCASLLESIAKTAERMNAFARELQNVPLFSTVVTGSDIRYYKDGWKIEKYAEAKLKNKEEQFAVWWLELSFDGTRWKIDIGNDITHGAYYYKSPTRFGINPSDAHRKLEFATDELENSFAAGTDFRRAIES